MNSKLTPEQVVRAWNEAYSRRDVDGALKYMSEDFKRYGDSGRWVAASKRQWAAEQKGFFAAFPDWTWTLNNLIASGDLVACEFLERGTFTEPYSDFNRIVSEHMGQPMSGLTIQPTGQSYSDYNSDWIRVEDGLIVELRAYITNNLERTYKFESKIIDIVTAQMNAAAHVK